MDLKTLREKVEMALCDPKAPWYGSDLVSWVDDLMKEYDRFHEVLQTETGKNMKLTVERDEVIKAMKDTRAERDELREALRVAYNCDCVTLGIEGLCGHCRGIVKAALGDKP